MVRNALGSQIQLDEERRRNQEKARGSRNMLSSDEDDEQGRQEKTKLARVEKLPKSKQINKR